MAAFYGEQATLREAGTTVDASMSGGQVHAVVDEYITAGTEDANPIYFGGLHIPVAATAVDAWISNEVYGASSNNIGPLSLFFNSTIAPLMALQLHGDVAAVVRPTSTGLPVSVIYGTSNIEGLIFADHSAAAPSAGKSIVACVMYVTGA